MPAFEDLSTRGLCSNPEYGFGISWPKWPEMLKLLEPSNIELFHRAIPFDQKWQGGCVSLHQRQCFVKSMGELLDLIQGDRKPSRMLMPAKAQEVSRRSPERPQHVFSAVRAHAAFA